jgi:hydrogenase/urease accessory protein HupE
VPTWLPRLAFFWLISPSIAFAHSPSKGLIGFYTGVIHIFTEAALVMAFLALGLLVSQTVDLEKIKKLLWVFLVTIIASTAFALLSPLVFEPRKLFIALWALIVFVCIHAALLPRWTPKVATVSVISLGLVMGQMTVPDPGPFWSFTVTTMGSIAGCFLGFLYAALLFNFAFERFHKFWQRTVLRVLAAWLFAIAFLLSALQIAGKPV